MDKGIKVVSRIETVEEARKNGFSLPEAELEDQSTIKIGDTEIETFYPGEGHTSDNIVVWLPQSKVLFGGCLVKPMNAKDLGNIKEANVDEWPNSIDRVIKQYPKIEVVIPGHGAYGAVELLEYTKTLSR